MRAGHPFDLTKTRLQTAAPGTYTGAIDVVKKALARDGAAGSVSLSSCSFSEMLTASSAGLVSTVVLFPHYSVSRLSSLCPSGCVRIRFLWQ